MSERKKAAEEEILRLNRELQAEINLRRRTEDTLRQYKTAVESTNDMVLVHDRRYRCIFANTAYLRYHGLEKAEVLGKTCAEIVGEKAFREIIKPNFDLCLSGIPVRFEMSHPYGKPDGRHLLVRYSPLPDALGGTAGTVAIITDITETRRVQDTFRESEQKLREVLENSFEVAYRKNLKTDRYDYISPAFFNISGYTIEEMSEMSIGEVLSLVHPDDRERIKQTLAEAAESRKDRYLLEYRFRCKDGSYKWFSDLIRIVGDESGNPLYRVGSVRDIGEQKQMEEALRESEGQYRSIFENSSDGILVMIPSEGRILSANPAACRMLGRTEEQICREGKENLIDTTDPRFREFMKEREHTGKTRKEIFLKKSDGTRLPCEASSAMFEGRDGTLRSILILRDISDRKRAEKKIKAYMTKLEQSNQALQDFASIASHDMQEPLRKVMAFGSRLKNRYSSSLGEEGKDYLDRMLNATVRMQNLLQSLLEYSSVTTQAKPFREVNLNDVLQEVLSDLEIRIEQTGGRVEVSELPILQADLSQMQQLFQNLLCNALKFHKQGETPIVKVYGQSVPDAPGCYEIRVEDNGIGFDEKYLGRIFSPFQRLHGRSSEYEGTGMGLAICKKIVERHGGSIQAKSEPGKGSTFLVTLPIERLRSEGEE